MTTAQIATRKNLYRRIRSLSDVETEQVFQYIDDLKGHEPNEETIAAMEEAERIARDPGAEKYTDVKKMFAELRAECTK